MNLRTGFAFIYGIAVVVSGLMRYFLEPGGETGLWFGVVFGLVALGAAALLLVGKQRIGIGLIWIVIAFVGGWFFYEALIKKGLSNAEPRQLVVLALSVVAAFFFLPLGGGHSDNQDGSVSQA